MEIRFWIMEVRGRRSNEIKIKIGGERRRSPMDFASHEPQNTTHRE